MNTSWSIFKNFVSGRSLSIQWIDLDDSYWLKAFDGPFTLECVLNKSNTTETQDFEDNFKSNGNKSPTTKLKPFSDTDGHKFRGKGFSGTATSGTTTNIQYKLTEERLLNGLELLIKNHVTGDKVHFEVVDVDYAYAGIFYPATYNGTAWSIAAPTGVVLDRFAEDWNLSEDVKRQGPYLLSYPARIYANLYLRVVYVSTGEQNVDVRVNAFLHKKI